MVPEVIRLEERCLMAGGWLGYAGDAQHTAQTSVAAQPLQTIRWQATIDQASKTAGGDILAHYGSPLVTNSNTVIVPITLSGGVFQVNALQGGSGAQLWAKVSDYSLPTHDWTPPFSSTLANIPGTNPLTRLYFAGADGTVEYIDNPDSPSKNLDGSPVTGRFAFYGLAQYNIDVANKNANIAINTPLTADAVGNIYFGYVVSGTNAANLSSGIARIAPDGTGKFVAATTVSLVAKFNQVALNCAPAISNDGAHLYIALTDSGSGELLELKTADLTYVARAQLLDPAGTAFGGQPSTITGDSSATPTVGPDGDVYFGVLEHSFGSNHDRGWLLHFSGDLLQSKPSGFFGWDDTASVVPAALVPSYLGTSSYLLMTKYNDYAGIGGTGINKIAILDPDTRDPNYPATAYPIA